MALCRVLRPKNSVTRSIAPSSLSPGGAGWMDRECGPATSRYIGWSHQGREKLEWEGIELSGRLQRKHNIPGTVSP